MSQEFKCSVCGRSFQSLQAKAQHADAKHPGEVIELEAGESAPDWSKKCQCGATPVHPITGMCGPCTFGEAATVGGNW